MTRKFLGTYHPTLEIYQHHSKSDTFYHLWTSPIFQAAKLEAHSILPATILTLLDKDDADRLYKPVTKTALANHFFHLHTYGTKNRSVTNKRDMLYIS